MANRRPFPRRRRSLLGLIVCVVVVVVAAVWQQFHPAPPMNFDEATAVVRRVVDGDTLLLTDKRRVRLIGADTPETVKPDWPVEPWGPEATEFTRKFCAGGKVRLEFDEIREDRFGRTLAYVWVGDRMLNEELIRAGLARAEPQYRYSAERKARFMAAEREANSAHRGVWSQQIPPPRELEQPGDGW